MPNPVTPSPGTPILDTWGADVVSRVVGIYTSLSAAEADGRVFVGSLVALTDGTLWIKQSGTTNDWRWLGGMARSGNRSFGALTLPATSYQTVAADSFPPPSSSPQDLLADAWLQVQNNVTATVDLFVRISSNAGASWNNGTIFNWPSLGAGYHLLAISHEVLGATPTANIVAEIRVRTNQANQTTVIGGSLDFRSEPQFAF